MFIKKIKSGCGQINPMLETKTHNKKVLNLNRELFCQYALIFMQNM
jgi:hypothetical protein